MATELPNTTEATRRDGSPLTEGLGLAPERAAPRMGKEAEQECFAEWIRTACPFDENVGMVENAIQTSAAWAGWLARSALRDWLYAELQETKRENESLRRRLAELKA